MADAVAAVDVALETGGVVLRKGRALKKISVGSMRCGKIGRLLAAFE